MSQSSLLIKGMVIIAISVLFVSAGMIYAGLDYLDPNFAAKWYPYEIALAVLMVLLWYVLLRKDIPLNFSLNFNKTFFITLPIFLVPFSLLVWVLLTSETLDSTKLWMFFATAVSVGIAEELIFRVAGYRVLLATGSSTKRAILISALLFSLFHLTNLFSGMPLAFMGVQLVNTFMMGVIFAYIYYKTESFLYMVLLHFMWDFSTFTSSAFKNPESNLQLVMLILPIGYFIWAIINVVKLKK